MINFAQLTRGHDGQICTMVGVPESTWLAMLIISLLLALIFFLVRKAKYGVLFCVYAAALLWVRSLHSYRVIDPGFGSLCKESSAGFIVHEGIDKIYILQAVIIATLIIGMFDYWRSRSKTSKTKK